MLSLAISANVIYINTETTDALRKALNNAQSGDIIEMAAGTYVESPSNYIAFAGKDVIVRAAEGAEVIVKPHVPITLSAGARAEIRGIKIDASELCSVNSYSHLIYPSDAVDNNRLVLDGCEIYGFDLVNSAIYCSSSKKLDAVSFNNCYFHDMMKSVLFIESTAGTAVQITNSTFANIETSSSYSAGVIDTRATSGSFSVDHCTFYNCKVINTDYGTIGKVATPGAVVSNCIFAMPESTADLRAIRDVATANNCLTYNYTKDSNWGIHSSVTKNNCIQLKDPLFTDADNGDFSFAGNWVTMELSPARGAATDGSDLGDPRWYSAEVLPSTDFAPSYVFLGAKAQLSGSFALNGDSYIQSDGTTTDGLAVWKIQATRKCIVDVTLNIADANTSGHRYEVALYDANNALVGTALAESENSWSHGDKVLGSFEIPAAGNYTVKLTNDCDYSSTIIEGVTFAYVGGDVQAMPGTTDVNDAWFSSNGTRADGKISYSSIGSGCWAKWNIALADAGTYNVIVNIQNQYGHNYTVEFLKEGEVTPISVSEGETKYGHDETLYPVEVGAIALEAGNYVMTVSNAIGDAKLLSTTLAYAGGAAVDLSKDAPANLLANADAIVSDDWTIEDGKITHAESKALTGWAKWNVNSADYGNYNVTVNIASDNGHLVRVEIFEDETAAPIYTLDETSATQYHTGDQAIDLGNIVLDAREYVVKVSNTGEYSHVQIASIVISYLNGARATLPASCTFADLMLSPKAQIYNDMLYFEEPGDHNPVGQWAKWNVKAAAAGTFLFTMNVTSDNSQSYKISILDMNENELDAFESGSVGSGDKEVKHYFNLAAGNYIVKLENSYAWSRGHVVSLVVTQPELLVLDEAALDNSVLVANYYAAAQDIQIIRSIVPNMYNTICLPFDVSSSQLPAIFGSDVVLKQMSGATLSGNELTLSFDDATSIYRGTPYLIMTTKAVVNPVFTDAIIKAKVAQSTSGDAAEFIGNFIKSEVPAGDQNLFLMQDNELFFRQSATPIKGMRAYFHVNVPGAAQAIQRIRIEEAPAVTTGINRVEANGSVKTIENGQLVIIRDGKKYNVMGIKLQ